eukprot:3337312-Amphidinium_carterae.2
MGIRMKIASCQPVLVFTSVPCQDVDTNDDPAAQRSEQANTEFDPLGFCVTAIYTAGNLLMLHKLVGWKRMELWDGQGFQAPITAMHTLQQVIQWQYAAWVGVHGA